MKDIKDLLVGEQKKEIQVNIKMSFDEVDRVDVIARQCKISRSKAIRLMCKVYTDNFIKEYFNGTNEEETEIL